MPFFILVDDEPVYMADDDGTLRPLTGQPPQKPERHEAVKLFEPAPEQLEGQTSLI